MSRSQPIRLRAAAPSAPDLTDVVQGILIESAPRQVFADAALEKPASVACPRCGDMIHPHLQGGRTDAASLEWLLPVIDGMCGECAFMQGADVA